MHVPPETAYGIRGSMTVREVIARFPETYHVFHRFRMDTPGDAECTIGTVAAAHARDPAALLDALNGAVCAARHAGTDPTEG